MPKAWTQGPHWGLPIGLETRTRVRIDEVRRLEIGIGGGSATNGDEFLTADLNLLRVCASVQYRVSDPVAFVLRADDVEGLLATWAESSLSARFRPAASTRFCAKASPRSSAKPRSIFPVCAGLKLGRVDLEREFDRDCARPMKSPPISPRRKARRANAIAESMRRTPKPRPL